MRCMIAELVINMSNVTRQQQENDQPNDGLPRAGYANGQIIRPQELSYDEV